MTDRTRSVLGGVGRAGRRTLQSVRLLGASRMRASGRPAEQLLLMPQDLRTADPSFATEIYYGQFGLAGRIAQTGSSSPFAIPPPSPEWQRELHGFGWLRHLRAAGDQISREHARALAREWLRSHMASRGLPWEPEIVARRTISWLAHASLLIEGADAELYDDFMGGLARQVRYVGATYADAPDGVPRLVTLSSLLLFGLCVAEQQSYLDRYARPLSDELERQILADGGHVSRNPLALVDALLDLLPLRHCFSARDRVAPKALTDAIDRMMPMLRFFRLGDGGLARFNGVGLTPTDALATVLACDDAQGRPVSLAPDSGYCRLERGETIVVADVGKPPPKALGARAHAGCLSFEMSTAEHLVVVNCGAPGAIEEDWRTVCRATAAHSTLIVEDTSSSRIARGTRGPAYAPLAGLNDVKATLAQDNDAIDLVAMHDGYVAAFGLIHTRRLSLAPTGSRLLGEDYLNPSRKGPGPGAQKTFAIRFHLHPSVQVEALDDGRTVMLGLPNQDVWRLVLNGGAVQIEESAYLGDPRGPRRSRQIVVLGRTSTEAEARIDWILEQRSDGSFPIAGGTVMADGQDDTADDVFQEALGPEGAEAADDEAWAYADAPDDMAEPEPDIPQPATADADASLMEPATTEAGASGTDDPDAPELGPEPYAPEVSEGEARLHDSLDAEPKPKPDAETDEAEIAEAEQVTDDDWDTRPAPRRSREPEPGEPEPELDEAKIAEAEQVPEGWGDDGPPEPAQPDDADWPDEEDDPQGR